jgi:hypothetical protein
MSRKIFISHAVKDKVIADAFVDLILQGALSVPINEIFCVSTDGTKIKSGDDWRDSIKSNILSAKINFLIISPNYKESEVCLNEMGAAWMTDSIVLPLILTPINYKTVGVIQEPLQIEKLLDENSLDRIKDIVQEVLEINSTLIKSDRWTVKKKEFLIRVKKHIVENPFETPIDRLTFKQLEKDKAELEETIINLIQEKSTLEDLVEELKKAKDRTEVESIIKSRINTSQFDEFIQLAESVKKLLNRQSSIMNGIIFKNYSGKNLNIGWEGNRRELDEAIANDYIDEDLDIKWDSTKEMRNIYSALEKVTRFMNSKIEEDFFTLFEEDFECNFEIKNKKFWEEVFAVSISLN